MNPEPEPIPSSLDPEGAAKDGSDDGDLTSSGSEDDGGQRIERLRPLDQRVQRWIWKEGWSQLRDIQEEAIPAILPADQDVVIASATASGKTEAAFLPIGSVLATDEARGSGFST